MKVLVNRRLRAGISEGLPIHAFQYIEGTSITYNERFAKCMPQDAYTVPQQNNMTFPKTGFMYPCERTGGRGELEQSTEHLAERCDNVIKVITNSTQDARAALIIPRQHGLRTELPELRGSSTSLCKEEQPGHRASAD